MNLQIGDTIKNKKPYKGEGERIVCELGKNEIRVVHACNTKYPHLNGLVEVMSYDSLQYYEKIK